MYHVSIEENLFRPHDIRRLIVRRRLSRLISFVEEMKEVLVIGLDERCQEQILAKEPGVSECRKSA